MSLVIKQASQKDAQATGISPVSLAKGTFTGKENLVLGGICSSDLKRVVLGVGLKLNRVYRHGEHRVVTDTGRQ